MKPRRAWFFSAEVMIELGKVDSAECIAECAAVLGEGPVWVEREAALYWVDIKAPLIWRLDYESQYFEHWTPPFRICSIAPREEGGFVAGTERGFALIDLAANRYEIVARPEIERPRNRFNDGKIDRAGRFWAGTMDDAEREATGALYRLDPDLRWERIDDGYGVANGPAFSPDGRRMYHSDSAARTIYLFDLDEAGRAGNKRLFARFEAEDGYPDGMTVDAEGCLWVAFWDGWCVRRLAPDGERIGALPLPVQRPTSCAFGGPDLDRLFITSATVGLAENHLAMQPFAGGLFVALPGVRGVPGGSFAG